MQQNTNHIPAGAAGRGRHRQRRNHRILLLAAFALIPSILILALKPPPEASASGDAAPALGAAAAQAHGSRHEAPIPEAGYNYAEPVPESQPAENRYFDDAVLIGDSRTEGLVLYTGLSNALSYTHKGLTVETVFTKPVVNRNGAKLSVVDALRQTDFGKVYIMLGINETGWPHDRVFIEKYGRLIDELQAINPQAVIYVQEILPVSNSVSQTHRYVTNEKIRAFNTLIRQMAEEKQIYYIDTGTAVSDADGSLPEAAASDGIHLKKPYCEKWLAYLKTHTVTEGER